MRFSLILSTKVRVTEIERFLQSLAAQTLQDYELILSDQNDDNRVADMLAKTDWAASGKLVYIRSSGGLSGGRNAGLAIAKGDILGFPDDDCSYFPTMLADVSEFFDSHPEYGYLSGRSIADDGGDAVSKHAKVAGRIQRHTIYSQCMEFALFARHSTLGDVCFDGNMGVGCGSRWQSDEGPDFMLNLEKNGVHGYYDPKFAVWHPRSEPTYDDAMLARCYKYSCGSGYFLHKHRYPFWFFLKLNAKSFCGAILGWLTLKPKKANFYLTRIRGRWDGWKGYAAEQVGRVGAIPSSAK